MSAELYHFGVKGMKWGKRKGKENSQNFRSGMKARNASIKNDRQEIRKTATKLRDEERAANSIKNGQQRAIALEKVRSKAAVAAVSDRGINASRLTTGEALLATILTGPVGAGIILATEHDYKQSRKNR